MKYFFSATYLTHLGIYQQYQRVILQSSMNNICMLQMQKQSNNFWQFLYFFCKELTKSRLRGTAGLVKELGLGKAAKNLFR